MSRSSLLPWFFILLACACKRKLPLPQELKVGILPMECSSYTNLSQLSSDINAFYNCHSVVLPNQKLPKFAFYKPRNRYRADSILKHLNHLNLDTFDVLLAVTSKDISATVGQHEDWGVFGYGDCPGNVCVVSDFRLYKQLKAGKVSTRLKNVAIHEIGHNFGLSHCGDSTCLMKDAKGKLSSVEGANRKFCDRCKNRIYE